MKIFVFPNRQTMSEAAARHVAASLQRAIAAQGEVRMVPATAASQLEFQRALVRQPGVDWSGVEVFQLDEYIGLPDDHPASFRTMLRANLIDPTSLGRFHLIEVSGSCDPEAARARLNRAIAARPVDLAVLGIGENAHLAFNDPPADFETTDPYIVVSLDEACRRQQVGEGWFARLEDVPARAVSMSVRQMLSAREIIVIVPDERKAAAVKATLESPIDPSIPASILRTHDNVTLYLDEAAASAADPAELKTYLSIP
jgi:glucosamine-6-phosphate deaminase